MDINLRTPPELRGTEKEQLHQIRSYLYQMQQSLMVALDGLTPEKLALDAANAVRGAVTLPDGTNATLNDAYRALKSIIIKTADTVQKEVDEVSQRLESDYVSNSTFGTYQEAASAEMVETATGIVTSYGYESQLSALGDDILNINNFNISTQQYIKSGLLFFDEDNVPRYGVAVGENLTTVVVDGETVLQRAGLAATFTSDRLSFWQNEEEVAYISNKQLYINEVTILGRLFIGKWVIDTTYGFALKWAGEA